MLITYGIENKRNTNVAYHMTYIFHISVSILRGASKAGDSPLEGFQFYDRGHPDVLAMTGKGLG